MSSTLNLEISSLFDLTLPYLTHYPCDSLSLNLLTALMTLPFWRHSITTIELCKTKLKIAQFENNEYL
jgi:hypothetical protein